MISTKQSLHLVLGDQTRGQLLGERRVSLMIDEYQLDLGGAHIRQAFRCGERQVAELGMLAIDDLGCDFDRCLGCLAGCGGVAGERHEHSDLDGLGGPKRRRRQSGCNRGHQCRA